MQTGCRYTVVVVETFMGWAMRGSILGRGKKFFYSP